MENKRKASHDSLQADQELRESLPLNSPGIPVKPSPVKELPPKKSLQVDNGTAFIKRHIEMRLCDSFVPVDYFVDDLTCKCGHPEAAHTKQALNRGNDGADDEWLPDRDTVAVNTNAFGEVEFVENGDKIAKYVRADVDTSPENIMELLTEGWGLEMPNLVISITGGSSDFDINSRVSEAFKHGLMKLVSTTRAWILTRGTHAGVTKLVGEAVHEYCLTSTEKVVAIGVAPWGCVVNNDILVQRGTSVVPYEIKGEADDVNMAFLDPNHSHFILTDDGTRLCYEANMTFKAKVLKILSDEILSAGISFSKVNVPVCHLVINGGKGTLENVVEAVKMKIPTVVFKGTGSMADILAFAYEKIHGGKTNGKGVASIITSRLDGMKTKIKRTVRNSIPEYDAEKCVQLVADCMADGDVISVLDFDARISAVDVDLAILKALLKVNRGKERNRLRLALVLNRIDIAEGIIRSEENPRREAYLEQLNETMQLALTLGNAKFVNLLLENGLHLKEFLTDDRLQNLYNKIPRTCLLRRLLLEERKGAAKVKVKVKKRLSKEFTIKDVGNVIQRLLDVFHNHDNLQDQMCQSLGHVDVAPAHKAQVDNNGGLFAMYTHPQHLFIWSILMNKKELSKIFWRESKECMAMALFAQAILKAMMKNTNDKFVQAELRSTADDYGQLAFGVLEACYSSDPKRTLDVVMRYTRHWGAINCILLAFYADHKDFLVHKASHSLLDRIWKGRIAEGNSFLKILVCAFLPFLLFLVRFRPRERKAISESRTVKAKSQQASDPSPNMLIAQGKIISECLEWAWDILRFHGNTTSMRDTKGTVQEKDKSCCHKPAILFGVLRDFYSAPVVTFSLNVMFYLVFLLMYSYFLLVKISHKFNHLEVLLVGWVGTIALDELRQLITSPGATICRKVERYMSDQWNKLDVISVILFAIGMSLRHATTSYGEEARIILSLSFITFSLRILHIFSMNSKLGPMVVMVIQMVKDLMWFGIIVAVFIVSYGIASEAILCPSAELSFDLLYNIPRRPYWEMYGNLFLEELEGDSNINCPTLTTPTNCSGGPCPSEKGKIYVTVLLGAYVLLTNVLLMNLVIAMFSSTFQRIQEESKLHWCYQLFDLVCEYAGRPSLPPPLIVVAHIYRLLGFSWRNCRNRKMSRSGKATFFKFRKTPASYEDKDLVQWEKVIADNYIGSRERDNASSLEKRHETIMAEIQEIKRALNHLSRGNSSAD